jgi:hypothetical protein
VSKLEGMIFAITHLCLVLLIKNYDVLWKLTNEAQTSFMSNLYFTSYILLIIGGIFALILDYGLLHLLYVKIKGDKNEN